MPVETIQVGGSAMPTVGLGLWKADGTDVAATVVEAAAVGYRHFDSAADYGNEISPRRILRIQDESATS